MTREEFILHYEDPEPDHIEIPMPCACGHALCEGWQMVVNTPYMLKHYLNTDSTAEVWERGQDWRLMLPLKVNSMFKFGGYFL